MGIPEQEVFAINRSVRIEVTLDSNTRTREFVLIPGDEVLTIHDPVQAGIAFQVRIA